MEENYHNTVPEEGERLHGYQEKAKTRDQMVLEVFKWNQGVTFTPSDIYEILTEWGDKILLTSVRRAISNLTRARRLVKCQRDQARPGIHKRNNRAWRYNDQYLPNLATRK